MNSFRRHHLVAAISALLTASALAGCGGGATATAPASFADSAPVSGPQAASFIPDTAVDGEIFVAGGKPQILVKSRSSETALAARFPGLQLIRTLRSLGVQVLGIQAGSDMEALLAALRKDRNVIYAEPNYVVRMFGLAPGSRVGSQAVPNDPMFGDQYAPQIVKAPDAWDKSTGKDVTVAVVDTGIDITHPDLSAKILPGFAAADASPTLTPPEKDDNGHGTHVAGITAALVNNGVGIAGMAPEARLVPVKVLSAAGSGSYAGVAEGIVWAAEHGAQVINMSLGGSKSSRTVEDAVKLALNKNVVVVAAMGNSGNGKKSYPAAIAGVVAVGATDRSDALASFSQYGTWISVTAPGVKILSSFPTYEVELNKYGFPQNYAVLDGTSMATPAVSGLAALVRAAFPGLAQAEVKKRIEANADDLGDKGFDIHYGYGRVNALKAVS